MWRYVSRTRLVGDVIASVAQFEASTDLATRWHLPTAAEPRYPGQPIARLQVPRLGGEWVVLEGMDPATLTGGPGHDPDTAQPGRPGTCVLVGHDAGHGAPFRDLARLQPGDQVLLEDRHAVWTYHVLAAAASSDDCGGLVLRTAHPPGGTASPLAVYAELLLPG